MVEYGKHALDWCSNNFPGVPYPYQKTTIFRGFAGMEYPMMVNDESYPDPNFARFVAEHEILHTSGQQRDSIPCRPGRCFVCSNQRI